MSATDAIPADHDAPSPALDRSPRRRETVFAVIILLAVTLTGFYCLTLHPTDLLVGVQKNGENDVTSYFLACRDLPRLLFSQYGQLPLWNPHSMAGTPYLGNPQAALFYPPNWIFYVIPARYAISWVMIAHHFWAGLGLYLLCRRYGCAWASAVFGGMSFLLAPYFVAHLGEGHYNQVCVASWLPWGLLAYECFRVDPAKKFALVVGVLVAAFFAGHPQELYYLVLLLCAFVASDLFVLYRARNEVDATQLIFGWGKAGFCTLGLVAIEMVPVLYYTQQSSRSHGMTSTDAGQGLSLSNLWELLNPMALGGPLNMDKGHLFYWESVCHFGVLPLLLAVIGVALAWRRRPMLVLAIFMFVAINFAFGHTNWLFLIAHKIVPGIMIFRAPSRILFLCSMAVAVMAAIGFDELVKRIHVDTQRRILPLSLAFVAALALIGAVIGPMHGEKIVIGVSSATWLCVFISTVGLVAASLVPKLRYHAIWLVGLAGLVELTMHTSSILRTIPQESIRMDSVIVEKVQQQKTPTRILAQHGIFSELEAWTHSIDKPQAYEPVPPVRYVASLDALEKNGPENAIDLMQGFKPVALFHLYHPMADMLGIGYVAALPHRSDSRNGWNEIWRGTIPRQFSLRGETPTQIPTALYENPTVLPRAYVVGKAQLVPDERRTIEALEKLDPRSKIILKQDPLPPGDRAEFAPAEIEEYSANRVILRAKLDQPGFLFVSDMWYPGWKATDNGNRTMILPANLAFRAIPLARGEHRVVMTYTPPGLVLGFTISLFTLFILIYLWIRARTEWIFPKNRL